MSLIWWEDNNVHPLSVHWCTMFNCSFSFFISFVYHELETATYYMKITKTF